MRKFVQDGLILLVGAPSDDFTTSSGKRPLRRFGLIPGIAFFIGGQAAAPGGTKVLQCGS
jgi:hypothetical protein